MYYGKSYIAESRPTDFKGFQLISMKKKAYVISFVMHHQGDNDVDNDDKTQEFHSIRYAPVKLAVLPYLSRLCKSQQYTHTVYEIDCCSYTLYYTLPSILLLSIKD